MKRFIFSAIALMVAVTSCTESGLIDTPDFYGKAIVFDSYIGKTPVTKAENCDIDYLKMSEANGGGAQLYAFTSPQGNRNRDYVDYDSPYLNGRLVFNSQTWAYKVEDKNEWVVEEPYMPTDKDLAVVAYNLKADNATYISNRNGLTQFDFTVADNAAQQVDLLATPLTFVAENPNGDTSVPLRFFHLLSRIGFKVLSTNGSDTQIKFKSIKLCGGFPKSGRVDLTIATATPATTDFIALLGDSRPAIRPLVEGDNAYEYEYDLLTSEFSLSASACTEEPHFIGNDENNRFMMIIPGRVRDLEGEVTTPHIKVEYSLGGSEDRISTIWLTDDLTEDGENWNFEAGKAYEFILKLATASIEFTGEVVEGSWDEQTPEEKPL